MLTNLLSLISSSDPMVCFSVVVSLAAMITAFVILGLVLVFQRLTRRRRSSRLRLGWES
ncbi:MAG TPA: hypothetical protein VD738_04165 [Nitrospira sp.]|nr:hypothetical protein [Nitrospira sp.]